MKRITGLPSPWIQLVALLFPAVIHAANLEPATLQAWDQYVDSAKTRMEQRLTPANVFLWIDESPGRLAKVRAGEIVVSPVGQNPKKVPSGLIHDWLGAAFIPNATLPDVLQVVRDYPRFKDLYRPAIIDSKAIATSESKDRFSVVLMNKSFFLKTALDTDNEASYVHVDDRRVYSISRATRIQEIEEYGAPAQHVLDEGEGKGIVWRLFSITRYVERDGGVYIENEIIGLSRDIPASLKWLVDPVARRVARSSLSTSLEQTQNAVHLHSELANGKPRTVETVPATSRKVEAEQNSFADHSSR